MNGLAKLPFLVALLALLVPLLAHGAVIEEVRFSGNETTKERVMLQEMSIRVGDPVDRAKIEKSRQAIMDLGLFKSVKAELLDEADKKVLLITVEEKWYILPLPLIDVRLEGDYSYGLEIRHDNVAGLNQRVKLGYEESNEINSDVPNTRELELEYDYPRVIGSPYSFDFSAKVIRDDLELTRNEVSFASYQRDSYRSSVGLSRWLREEGATSGWYYGFGLSTRYDEYEHFSGQPGLYRDSQSIGVRGQLGFKDLHNYEYYRDGVTYGISTTVGAPQLGSDYSFYNTSLSYRRYIPLRANKSNFNMRYQVGLANGCNFGCVAYGLGGGNDLRGYDGDYVSGNAFALANLEYLHQISGYKQLRAVLFTDIGNAYPGPMEIDLGELKVGVGFGLRWRVQVFVDLTLRVDVAYGLEAETQKNYLTTSVPF